MPGTEEESQQHAVITPAVDAQGKYQYVRTLGSGTFSSVLLAKDVSTDKQVAIKLLNRTTSDLQEVEVELLNHSALRHPHVVQFREVFLTDRHINVVMDFANGRSLFEYVKARTRLREPLARWFFQQLILAVDYCHRKGVAHRDIKLEKILLVDVPGLPRPLVRLCGFGNGKHNNHSHSPPFKVPEGLVYTAPEVVQDKRLLGKAADVWSCGVVLYTMLVGKYPFQGGCHIWQRMQEKDLDLESPNLPRECRALLQQMLQPEISARISISGILSHPWFLADLPAGAADMNDRYLSQPQACEQTEADILTIIKQAQGLPA